MAETCALAVFEVAPKGSSPRHRHQQADEHLFRHHGGRRLGAHHGRGTVGAHHGLARVGAGAVFEPLWGVSMHEVPQTELRQDFFNRYLGLENQEEPLLDLGFQLGLAVARRIPRP